MATGTPPALALANYQRMRAVRAALVRQVSALWQSEPEPPVDKVVRQVLAGQRAAVTVMDGYMASAATAATGTRTAPIGLDAGRLIGAHARNGVTLEQVYERAVAVGRDRPERGLVVAQRSAATDFQLAHRAAGVAIMVATIGIVGYRRVIGGGRTCDRCAAASTQRYRRSDLSPMHPHCGCSVAPIYGTRHTRVDRDALAEVYGAGLGSVATSPTLSVDAARLPAGATPDLIAEAGVTVRHDVELGPVLDSRRHDITI